MRNSVRLCKLFTMSFLLSAFACTFRTAQAAELTPKQFYLQYHQKCLLVSSPKALLSWRSKDSIARDQPISDEEIEQVYPMIKDMMSKNVTVISEEIKGDRATLKVTGEVPAAASADKPKPSEKPVKKGLSEQAIGVVLLIKEGGQWKMDHESWTSR